jgi:hypothetical protein
MRSPWASSPSVTTTHHSSCSREGRRCSPGPTRSASASPTAGDAWCATTCATAASRRQRTRRRLLTLAGTRAVAPGKPDADLPDHDTATMKRLFRRPMPDWTDREAVAEFAAAGAEILGDDPVAARAIAARIWDRTPGTAPPIQMANQLGMIFAKLDCRPRWRERLPEIEVPTLVVHGRRDLFFRSATARRLPARSPGRGCSSSMRPPLRSPMRRPARSPRRCSRLGRGRTCCGGIWLPRSSERRRLKGSAGADRGRRTRSRPTSSVGQATGVRTWCEHQPVHARVTLRGQNPVACGLSWRR